MFWREKKNIYQVQLPWRKIFAVNRKTGEWNKNVFQGVIDQLLATRPRTSLDMDETLDFDLNNITPF